eukprot:6204768-Pleurochrysis_carterae.AAC.5
MALRPPMKRKSGAAPVGRSSCAPASLGVCGRRSGEGGHILARAGECMCAKCRGVKLERGLRQWKGGAALQAPRSSAEPESRMRSASRRLQLGRGRAATARLRAVGKRHRRRKAEGGAHKRGSPKPQQNAASEPALAATRARAPSSQAKLSQHGRAGSERARKRRARADRRARTVATWPTRAYRLSHRLHASVSRESTLSSAEHTSACAPAGARPREQSAAAQTKTHIETGEDKSRAAYTHLEARLVQKVLGRRGVCSHKNSCTQPPMFPARLALLTHMRAEAKTMLSSELKCA